MAIYSELHPPCITNRCVFLMHWHQTWNKMEILWSSQDRHIPSVHCVYMWSCEPKMLVHLTSSSSLSLFFWVEFYQTLRFLVSFFFFFFFYSNYILTLKQNHVLLKTPCISLWFWWSTLWLKAIYGRDLKTSGLFALAIKIIQSVKLKFLNHKYLTFFVLHISIILFVDCSHFVFSIHSLDGTKLILSNLKNPTKLEK